MSTTQQNYIEHKESTENLAEAAKMVSTYYNGLESAKEFLRLTAVVHSRESGKSPVDIRNLIEEHGVPYSIAKNVIDF